MKISYENLEQIIAKCTSKEISLIIYLAQFQTPQGDIEGIDYKDAIAATGMSIQSFYNAIIGLEEKGLIYVDYSYPLYGFFKIKILNNVFENTQDYKKGYLNINLEFLHCAQFHKLSRVTKVLLLKIYKIQNGRKKKLIFSFENLMKWTGIRWGNIKRSLKQLAELLSIKIEHHTAVISMLYEGPECIGSGCILAEIFNHRMVKEADILNEHEVKNELVKHDLVSRKEHNNQPKELMEDTKKLFHQYRKSLGKGRVMEAVIDCYKRNGELIPAYINKTLSNIYRGAIKKRKQELQSRSL